MGIFAMTIGPKSETPVSALDNIFGRCNELDSLVPVWCVTPKLGRVIHRFHSSCPFSPSGRYLVLTRLSSDSVYPQPGDVAEIVLVDLHTGKTDVISDTRGWDSQLGAHAQWGANDTELFFNDLDLETWIPFGVKMNPNTREKKWLEGTVYTVSNDGRSAASTCLRRIGTTQSGYGVVVPPSHIPVNHGASNEDGLYVTNTDTGEQTCIATYRRIIEEVDPPMDMDGYGPGDYYGFHVKYNCRDDRLLLVLRYKTKQVQKGVKKYVRQVITMKPDGTDIRLAVPASVWGREKGNHPTWHPGGNHVLMNLMIDKNKRFLNFVTVRYDGDDRKCLTPVHATNGHPSMHVSRRYIMTDAYTQKDGIAPLYWIDLLEERRFCIARVHTIPAHTGRLPRSMRVDLHPAFDRTGMCCAFNGVRDGTRCVFVADLSKLIAGR